MISRLYECKVMHHRFSPRVHHFSYPVFMCAIDLDEWSTQSRGLSLVSKRRWSLFSLREQDYLPTQESLHHASSPTLPAPPEAPLRTRIDHFFAANGVATHDGRIILVTMPRVLGYAFNPVSFYFAFSPEGAPLGAITEVTNTFREVKPYFVPLTAEAGPSSPTTAFHRRVPKHFYVSPFSPVDIAFDFHLSAPADTLRIQIDTYDQEQRVLTSTLAGRQRALTTGRLVWFAVKYPLLSFLVMGRIHWHALKLWLKKIPWYAKAAQAADQKDLYRPHPSIAAPHA